MLKALTTLIQAARSIVSAAEKMTEIERSYRTLFSTMPTAYARCRIVWDSTGRAVDWVYLETNPAYWKTTGLGDVTGLRLTDVVPDFPITNADVLERYGRIAAGEIGPDTFETYVPALDLHLMAAVHSPMPGQFITIFADITEVLHEREELAQMKSQFIRNVTHEIRTPLAIIRGYVDILCSGDRDLSLGPLNAGQTEAMGIVQRRVRALQRLVQDITAILELDSIDGNGTIPPFAPVDLRALVLEACEDFGVLVRDKGLNLDCSKITSSDITVMGAERYISHAIDNLMRNAIKFTETGTITVALWKDENRNIKLSVKDTGIGIEPDQLDTIFERFYQANGSNTRQYEGSGLGLSVVRDVMALHGGRVTVTSAVGEGSEFVLSFPFHQEV